MCPAPQLRISADLCRYFCHVSPPWAAAPPFASEARLGSAAGCHQAALRLPSPWHARRFACSASHRAGAAFRRKTRRRYRRLTPRARWYRPIHLSYTPWQPRNNQLYYPCSEQIGLWRARLERHDGAMLVASPRHYPRPG